MSSSVEQTKDFATMDIASIQSGERPKKKESCCSCATSWFRSMMNHWSQKVTLPVGVVNFVFGVVRVASGDFTGFINVAGGGSNCLGTFYIGKFYTKKSLAESAVVLNSGNIELKDGTMNLNEKIRLLEGERNKWEEETIKWKKLFEEQAERLKSATSNVPALTEKIGKVADSVPVLETATASLNALTVQVSNANQKREEAFNRNQSVQNDLKPLFTKLIEEITTQNNLLIGAEKEKTSLSNIVELVTQMQNQWQMNEANKEFEEKQQKRFARHAKSIDIANISLTSSLESSQTQLTQMDKNALAIETLMIEREGQLKKLEAILEKLKLTVPKIKRILENSQIQLQSVHTGLSHFTCSCGQQIELQKAMESPKVQIKNLLDELSQITFDKG